MSQISLNRGEPGVALKSPSMHTSSSSWDAYWDRVILNIACDVCISNILGTWVTARHDSSHSQELEEDEDDTLGHTLVAQEGDSNVMSLTGPPHQGALL